MGYFINHRKSVMSDSIVIVAAKRTPMGGFMGALSAVTSTELGATAITAAINGIDSGDIDEVIMVYQWRWALQQ
jgi:acetyl-CoA C-acetyltransferase